MLYAFGPAQIADVHQAVDALFDFDERTEVGQIAYAALDGSSHRILVVQSIPRIRGQLSHAQRNSPLLRVHAEHHTIHLIADIDQLRRVLDSLGPGHLANMYQAFDALLQFHKCAVVGDADNASRDVRAYGITLRRVQPRVGRKLLKTQGDSLFIFVELEHLHLDLVANVNQVAGMGEASPGHIGDV